MCPNIGTGTSAANLDAFAQAGRTGNHYPAQSSDELTNALVSISKEATCTFAIAATPPDPNQVAVYLGKNMVPQDASSESWQAHVTHHTPYDGSGRRRRYATHRDRPGQQRNSDQQQCSGHSVHHLGPRRLSIKSLAPTSDRLSCPSPSATARLQRSSGAVPPVFRKTPGKHWHDRTAGKHWHHPWGERQEEGGRRHAPLQCDIITARMAHKLCALIALGMVAALGVACAGRSASTGDTGSTGGTIGAGGVPNTGMTSCCWSLSEGCLHPHDVWITGPPTGLPSACPTGRQCYEIRNCCGCCAPTLCMIGGANDASVDADIPAGN